MIRLLKQLVRKSMKLGGACFRFVARPVLRALKLDVASLAGCKGRLRVDPFTGFGRELLQFGERPTEAFTVPLMKTILSPGDVYCDVGAHWGTYVVVASELVGEHGRVIAIEPTAQNRAWLVANIALNTIKNVSVEPVAIGESSRTGVLHFGGDSGNLSALQLPEQQDRDAASAQRCEVTTLSAVLDRNNVPRVRLMKMDIEGGECRASRDISHYADRFDCIFIELHPPFENPAEDIAFLYRMLGDGRLLFVVDCTARKFIPIRSRGEFEAKLELYYFVSARVGGTDDFKSLLDNFHW